MNNIILYLCSWGPHAAFQDLQDMQADIPNEIKMIRIPCTGRMSKSLLFKAFEMGADGVVLVGCKIGACRYGIGTDSGNRNVEDTRQILDLLGLNRDRLQFAAFLPDESMELLAFLKNFRDIIQNFGPSQVKQIKSEDRSVISKEQIAQILNHHNIYACQDCGKCSSACSLALAGKPFSPRVIANSLIAGDLFSESVRKDIWSCLTCGICYDRCPSAVNFPEFIRDIRKLLKNSSICPVEAHGGFFQSLMRTMTTPSLKPKKWKNLPEDILTDPESTTLFFGGCASYFDTFFKNHLSIETFNILTDSLKLLNFFDIKPQVIQEERCCGHDLIWSGDEENFIKLAKLNTEIINNKQIETLVTSCPECYKTLAYDYPKYGFKINANVVHIYDLVETEIDKGAVDFRKTDRKMAFQDSCRLNRFENKSDLPLKLIKRFKPGSFTEMKGEGNNCCGNCAWTGCDSFSKALQVKRLKELHDADVNLLITSCPKCQIHLNCAMEDIFLGDKLKIEMQDLTSLIARTIYWK